MWADILHINSKLYDIPPYEILNFGRAGLGNTGIMYMMEVARKLYNMQCSDEHQDLIGVIWTSSDRVDVLMPSTDNTTNNVNEVGFTSIGCIYNNLDNDDSVINREYVTKYTSWQDQLLRTLFAISTTNNTYDISFNGFHRPFETYEPIDAKLVPGGAKNYVPMMISKQMLSHSNNLYNFVEPDYTRVDGDDHPFPLTSLCYIEKIIAPKMNIELHPELRKTVSDLDVEIMQAIQSQNENEDYWDDKNHWFAETLGTHYANTNCIDFPFLEMYSSLFNDIN